MAQGLRLDDELEDGVWFIRGEGYLDASTAEAMDGLVEAVFRQHCHKICFDLSEITYVSSAGAGVLMTAYKQAQVHGGKAVFMKLSDNVRSVFKTLGLLDVFTVVRTKDDAIEALNT